jgi:predicted MFS family arabinose efflux permease
MLSAFRVRSFRFQWPADLLASCALEMETLILGWYVMINTGSVLLLTVFGSLQYLGTLGAPLFGVLGDRVGARAVLCGLRAIYAAFATLLMVLSFAGLLSPAWVLVVAALSGLVRPSDLAMRNTLIGETIPPAHRMGALGMSRATTDSARAAGALVGAGLTMLVGLAFAYVIVTIFYVASVALTLRTSRRRPVPDPVGSGEPLSHTASTSPSSSPRGHELRDGLAHVVKTPELLAVMCLAFLVNLTAYPVSNGLLPYVARRVYSVDATGLGWLVATFALGGLLGSLTMVVTRGARRARRTMLVAAAIWYVLLLGFAQARSLGTGLVVLFLAGFAQNLSIVAMALVLLAASGERFRARVMGVRILAVYGLPLGLMASGWLVERIGYAFAISLSSAIGLVFTVLVGLTWRDSLWREPRRASATTDGERASGRARDIARYHGEGDWR